MSLTRVRNPLSLALIRRLGDAGGPRADQVSEELNSIIAWASSALRCIHRSTTVVGVVGAALTEIFAFSIPANTLATDGDYARGEIVGTFIASENDKRIRIAVGGAGCADTGLIDLDTAIGWSLKLTIIRVTATSVRVSVELTANVGLISGPGVASSGGNGFYSASALTLVAVPDLAANALAIQLAGQGGANNEVTKNFSIIELCQQ